MIKTIKQVWNEYITIMYKLLNLPPREGMPKYAQERRLIRGAVALCFLAEAFFLHQWGQQELSERLFDGFIISSLRIYLLLFFHISAQLLLVIIDYKGTKQRSIEKEEVIKCRIYIYLIIFGILASPVLFGLLFIENNPKRFVRTIDVYVYSYVVLIIDFAIILWVNLKGINLLNCTYADILQKCDSVDTLLLQNMDAAAVYLCCVMGLYVAAIFIVDLLIFQIAKRIFSLHKINVDKMIIYDLESVRHLVMRAFLFILILLFVANLIVPETAVMLICPYSDYQQFIFYEDGLVKYSSALMGVITLITLIMLYFDKTTQWRSFMNDLLDLMMEKEQKRKEEINVGIR